MPRRQDPSDRSASRHETYACGEWEIDLARRELRRDTSIVPIGPRALEIVEVLLQSQGDLVTKDRLLSCVWPGVFVDENTLHVHMSAVRKAFGSDRRFLQTIHGKGFRLIGDWAPKPPSTTTAIADARSTQ